MMRVSNRAKEIKELRSKFEDYAEPANDEKMYPLGYKIRDDAPEDVKKAHEKYIKILEKEWEERKNSPFE